jgi:hypothetical protein
MVALADGEFVIEEEIGEICFHDAEAIHRNPGYADVDFTLKKVTTITERVNLELRLDTFNIFNRVNYQGVDTNVQDGNFAQSTGTNPARNMLLGGRINF